MIKSLLSFLEECITRHCERRWLLAVPLCHFLQGCSVPYQPISECMGAVHNTPAWWGLQTLEPLVEKFKETSRKRGKDGCVSVYAIKISDIGRLKGKYIIF